VLLPIGFFSLHSLLISRKIDPFFLIGIGRKGGGKGAG